jgi:hypothetical protein
MLASLMLAGGNRDRARERERDREEGRLHFKKEENLF